MTSDSLLDILGPRSQQQQQPMALHGQYKRQGSLADQRLLASKKLQEVQGMGAKQGTQMSIGIGQHLDQVLGVQQHLQHQQQQQLGDGDGQLQQLMMQAPEMSQSQSRHMMGFRQQQQPQVTGAKQQVTSINQIQHLGTMQPAGQQHQQLTLMQQQQQPNQMQIGVMQQSGQHQQLVALQQHQQLGMIQQLGHHQQLAAMQQPGQHQQLPVLQQQGQQQLAALQQQGQHPQLTVLQQQGQHQQLAALQQQQGQQQQLALLQQQGQQQQGQHQQLAGLGQQSSQNQQLIMMRNQQRIQRLRQGGVSEMQQLQQLGGGTPGQQRLTSQGMSTQSIGQWGNMQRQQTLQVSAGQPDQGLSHSAAQMDMQKVPQSPSEFSGRKAEILQQLMAGIQQHQQQLQPVGGNVSIQDANNRTSVLQSGGGALQDSNGIGVYLQNHLQLMNGSTSQCNSQLMAAYDTVQASGIGGGVQQHFLLQQQQQVQPQQDTGTGGVSGNLMTDDGRRRRDEGLLYPNANESLKKGRGWSFLAT